MSRLLTLAATILLSVSLFAQKDKDIPGFGKVEKSELSLKECAFDKNAEAMVLFDVSQVYCSFYPGSSLTPVNTEVVRHVRIKILNDKGLKNADIKIPYYSYRNSVRIKNITANTYNLDAEGNIIVSKLEKKGIYDKKINARYSQNIFTFPEVKSGSIIEYTYTLATMGFGGLQDWYFQGSLPVALSRYTINFPGDFEVNCKPSCVLPLDIIKEKKGNRDIQMFTMLNIPALRDEPYITCDDDYLQRIEPSIIAINTPERRYSLIRTWPSVIKELMDDEDFGAQLKRNIPRTKDLDDSLKAINDPYTKMKIIHEYVRKNMEWNGYTSIWAFDGVRSAWSQKKGTTGEINLILVNLLKDAGLNAHPMLVSTRTNGFANTGFANVSQFDKVLAHVVINERTFVLDATEKITPSRLIPHEVMYSEGLVIEKLDTYEWGWQTLWNPQQQYKDLVYINANITEDGEIKGKATVSSFDYSRIQRLPVLKESKEKFLSNYFSSNNPGIKIDSLVIENEDIDSLPLIQKINFNQQLNSSGDYKYFSVNLFTGLEKNPFVADSRFSDVFFATNQQYSISGFFTIPENYAFEELPKSIRMVTADTSIVLVRRIASEGNRLSARINVEFRKPYYSIDEYPAFKEFYKKLADLLNEQFVIRKKVTP